jgi:hypothetical protein
MIVTSMGFGPLFPKPRACKTALLALFTSTVIMRSSFFRTLQIEQ